MRRRVTRCVAQNTAGGRNNPPTAPTTSSRPPAARSPTLRAPLPQLGVAMALGIQAAERGGSPARPRAPSPRRCASAPHRHPSATRPRAASSGARVSPTAVEIGVALAGQQLRDRVHADPRLQAALPQRVAASGCTRSARGCGRSRRCATRWPSPTTAPAPRPSWPARTAARASSAHCSQPSISHRFTTRGQRLVLPMTFQVPIRRDMPSRVRMPRALGDGRQIRLLAGADDVDDLVQVEHAAAAEHSAMERQSQLSRPQRPSSALTAPTAGWYRG